MTYWRNYNDGADINCDILVDANGKVICGFHGYPIDDLTDAQKIAQADTIACMANGSIILDNINSMPWYNKQAEIAESWGASIYIVADMGDDKVFTIGSTDVKVSTVDGSTTPAAGTWGE